MKKLLGTLLGSLVAVFLAHGAMADTLPYDETADAKTELTTAISKAKEQHKQVLVVFGANWCKDCRELDKALHGKTQPLIDQRFVVVKVDVGQFDKNKDLAEAYGNPIKKGIPAAVVLTSDNKMLYATKGGELADARSMGETGIYDFFDKIVTKQQ